jgi:hypothetical protein
MVCMRAVVARTIAVMARLGAIVAHLQTQRVIFAIPPDNGACVQPIDQTAPQNVALVPRNCQYEPENSKAHRPIGATDADNTQREPLIMHNVHFGPENERRVPESAAWGLESLTPGQGSATVVRERRSTGLGNWPSVRRTRSAVRECGASGRDCSAAGLPNGARETRKWSRVESNPVPKQFLSRATAKRGRSRGSVRIRLAHLPDSIIGAIARSAQCHVVNIANECPTRDEASQPSVRANVFARVATEKEFIRISPEDCKGSRRRAHGSLCSRVRRG